MGLARRRYVAPKPEVDQSVPEGVVALLGQMLAPDYEVISQGEHHCTIRYHDLELRFQMAWRGDHAGEGDLEWVFDEVVGPCQIHIEQMNTNDYWIGLYPIHREEDWRVCVDIGAARARVRMTGWME